MAKDDLYLLKVIYNSHDAQCQFGIGYRMGDGTYGVDTAFAVIEKFKASFLPSLQQALSDDVQFQQIDFGPIGISTELGSFGNMVTVDGQIANPSLPANMAAVIHFGTVAPNSKHNGRIYISGVPETNQFEGTMTAGQVTLLQDFADLLFGSLVPDSPEDSDFSPVVISRFVDGVKRVPPVGFDMLLPIVQPDLRQQQSRTTDRVGLSI